MQILLVDDDVMVLKSLARLLTTRGFDVTTAVGGAEGIRLLPLQRWCLVLTDLDMPDVSGIEVVQATRQLDPTPPVAIATGTPDSTHVAAAEELLGRPPLSKPLDPDTLDSLLASFGIAAPLPRPSLARDDPRSASSSPPPPSALGH